MVASGTIAGFSGVYRFLSNFWPATVYLDGVDYPSVEHAYQAAKTLDPQERSIVRASVSAGAAKKAGKKLTMRPDWENVKLAVMEDLVRQKFQHPELKEQLRKTYTYSLIETNWWGDTFWGVCKNVGQNHLGRILMKIRDELGK